jgi:general secretion pathway protein F
MTMQWRVRYMTLSDRSIGDGVFEAESADGLDAALSRDGRIALSSAPVRSLAASLRAPVVSLRTARQPSIPLLCEELKALLDAGLNLVEALDTLRASVTAAAEAELVARLLARVNEGKRLSDALDEEPSVPRVLVAVIHGSEFTSGVGQAVGRYLDYHRRLDELKSRVVSASIYPAIVLALGVAIVLFLLGYVVPRFSAIYAEHTAGLGAGSSLILAIGGFVGQYVWPIVAALAVLLAWAVFATQRLRRGGLQVDRLRGLPVVGTIVGDLESARLFETLSMLTAGGFPVPTALRIGREVALTRRTSEAVESVRLDVEAGGALSAALRRRSVGDEVAARLAGAGENSGDLARALGHVGEHHARRFSRRVERLTRVVEPLLLLLVGTTIGVIVLLMYMPIFDLAGSLR